MSLFNRYTVTGAALALATILASAPAFAQQPQPRSPIPAPAPRAQQPAQPSMIDGELVRVDANTKLLVVKTKSGDEQFKYTDATMVTGGQSGVAGLAKAQGTHVTVRFTGAGAERVATEITIHDKG